jgi:L-ascorbate metabolism protein UlaG (beta-lactamase superfamily)
MKITFLGTGAADWRAEHRDLEGYRRNASVLIDGVLLIDPGPDVPDALAAFGKDAGGIRYILNTHRHRDHYCAETFSYLRGAAFYPMRAGETATLGQYRVTALAANHGTARTAVHFLITDGERTLFYGLDGAWLLYDEVAAIQQAKPNLVVLDGTVGEQAGDYRVFEHNDLAMVRLLKAALAPHAERFCITHMSRKLHKSHAELASDMARDGIEVAFDGMEIEI